ncbi:MAG: hypothetical protein E6I75_23125 [Chloroflexi bacterium]|nr:MAG: hypothetical protein E6I75_23125 [Chloroflexota bacterium]
MTCGVLVMSKLKKPPKARAMTNKPPSTRAVNNRPRRRRREGLAAGAMPNETLLALVDPACGATCSSTDAPLRRSPGGAAFIRGPLEHPNRRTALARPLTAGDT